MCDWGAVDIVVTNKFNKSCVKFQESAIKLVDPQEKINLLSRSQVPTCLGINSEVLSGPLRYMTYRQQNHYQVIQGDYNVYE